jgi:HSP20 family protein
MSARWKRYELRQEIDRLFDDIGWGSWQPLRRSLFAGEPVFRRALTRATMPAVDIAESEKGYEIKADFPAWTRRTSRSK